MGSVEATKKALEEQPKPNDMRKLIEESAKELARALPEHMRPERLVWIALTCIRTTPKLAQCTPESFLGALFTAAQVGIEPVAGRAYILPFNNSRKKPDGTWHKVMEAQFIMGYRGTAELFYRHEKAIMLNWGVVHEQDEFSYEYGTTGFLRHVPAKGDRGPTTGYWVMAELANGGKPFMYMSLKECMEHGREHSKTFDKKTGAFYTDSPWATSPDSMCLKTVLIQLAKLLPLSVEVQRAIEADESSREYRRGIGNVLDIPSTTDWHDEPTVIDAPAPAAKGDEPPFDKTGGPQIEFGGG